MTRTVDSVAALVQRIRIMLAEQSHGQRLIVAIAGAPGAGKSTLAEQVCNLLNGADARDTIAGGGAMSAAASNRDNPGKPVGAEAKSSNPVTDATGSCAVVVPMDGFHLDNVLLRERGLMAVKGSPQTFDVTGFAALLQRLSVADAGDVYIPVFDRSADLSRNAAQCVTASHSVIIVEGNYLLLAREGWKKLAPLYHLSVMLDVPLGTLEERLVERWLAHGLAPEAARERALSNDIPNARLVQEESTGAHLQFKSVRQ